MRAVIINKKLETAEFVKNQDAIRIPEGVDEFIWLDSHSEDKQKEKLILENKFEISELSVNDAYRLRHPPKYEKFPKYSFVLIKAFDGNTEDIDFNILHISFFICDKFLITIHAGDSPSISNIWNDFDNNIYNSPHAITYKIIKTIIACYTKVVLQLEDRLEEIENEMLENPDDKLLGELIRYNSKTQYLTRIFSNQHAVFEEIIKQDPELSVGELRHQFIDIEEHMNRLAGLSSLLNSVIKILMDGYISVSSHRLNNIMKTLTIVAVIFLPLTFLAGIYGMNFQYMPELSFKYGYFMALAVMIILAGGLLMLFKKLKWI